MLFILRCLRHFKKSKTSIDYDFLYKEMYFLAIFLDEIQIFFL